MYADSRAPAASTSSTSPGRRRRRASRRTRPRRHSAAPNTAHASVCHAAGAPARRGDRPYQRSHASRRSRDQPVADAEHAHFLARRRRRRHREQMPRQPRRLRAALLRRALDAGPPRRGQHRRQREDGEQHERGMDRREQREGDAEPQDPAGGGEHRHVHVVEHEDLVAQHRQAIEIVGALVVRDRRDRRLQPRDVRLERDRHLVAEPPLHARAHRAQEPGRRRRHAEAERRRAARRRGRCPSTPSPSSLSHSAMQRVGQRRRAAPARTTTSISAGSCW